MKAAVPMKKKVNWPVRILLVAAVLFLFVKVVQVNAQMAEKQELIGKLKTLAETYGAVYSQSGEYPAWEYKKDSVLRDTMVQVYSRMFGKQPEVVAIHAGLECGLLSEKLPGLDCVSIGPEMHDIHTSRERLGIASTARMWEFIKAVLKAL